MNLKKNYIWHKFSDSVKLLIYKEKTAILTVCKMWLGWQDSNLRMSAPKADALPLGDTPLKKLPFKTTPNHFWWQPQ